jgi:c-di-GMP-binding flagellar brake protein YcgR
MCRTEVLALQSASEYGVQRKHQRYILSEPLILIRRLSPTDARREPGISTEISEGGMSAIVAVVLEVGDEVELAFDITSGEHIQTEAVVRNHYQFRHGFEFVSLSETEREKIRTACASLKRYEGGW